MWILYAVLAAVLAAVGVWPLALVVLLALPVIIVLGLRGGGEITVSRGTSAASMTSTREASYEPMVDPSRTPLGSTTDNP